MEWNWNVNIDVRMENKYTFIIFTKLNFLLRYRSYLKTDDSIRYTLSSFITLIIYIITVGVIFS